MIPPVTKPLAEFDRTPRQYYSLPKNKPSDKSFADELEKAKSS